MERQELAAKIYQVSYLTGEFQLRSGETSNQYFDKYRFESRPDILRPIAEHLAKLIPEGTEVLAGLEMGGIPIVTALSLQTSIPAVFVRKSAKEYGTCQFAEGLDVKNKQVCVIEDVVTSGGQLLISTRQLRELGAKVEHALCVILRKAESVKKAHEQQIQLHSLFSMQELIEASPR